MKSYFSILRRLTAYVVIGCVLSVVITVTTSALYPVFVLTGLLKLPLNYSEQFRPFFLQLQSGDVINVYFYDDSVVSVALLLQPDGATKRYRHSSSFTFSNDLLSRAYSQALVVASQRRLGLRDEPGGVLFGFGLPCTSAYFQVSWCSPGKYGYMSGGINPFSNQPILSSPFDVVIPYTLLWRGLLINTLFWAGTCFALHRGTVSLFKRLRASKVRSPQHAQRDGNIPRV